MKASDGNFYGTVASGGQSNMSQVYRLSSTGELTDVHSFSGTDGSYPGGELVEGVDGRLYGVTEFGGSTDAGVLFRIGARPTR